MNCFETNHYPLRDVILGRQFKLLAATLSNSTAIELATSVWRGQLDRNWKVDCQRGEMHALFVHHLNLNIRPPFQNSEVLSMLVLEGLTAQQLRFENLRYRAHNAGSRSTTDDRACICCCLETASGVIDNRRRQRWIPDKRNEEDD